MSDKRFEPTRLLYAHGDQPSGPVLACFQSGIERIETRKGAWQTAVRASPRASKTTRGRRRGHTRSYLLSCGPFLVQCLLKISSIVPPQGSH